MTQSNSISPSSMSSAAGSFEDRASQLGDALNDTGSGLGNLNGCWGDDLPGNAFGDRYCGPVRAFLNHCGTLVRGLTIVGDRLKETADLVQQLGQAETIR